MEEAATSRTGARSSTPATTVSSPLPTWKREIRDATGLSASTPPRPVIVRSVLDSIADGIAGVVDELRRSPGNPRAGWPWSAAAPGSALLHDLLGRRTGLRVVTQARPRRPHWATPWFKESPSAVFDGLDDARVWLEASGVRPTMTGLSSPPRLEAVAEPKHLQQP